jgi:hypothetical protein
MSDDIVFLDDVRRARQRAKSPSRRPEPTLQGRVEGDLVVLVIDGVEWTFSAESANSLSTFLLRASTELLKRARHAEQSFHMHGCVVWCDGKGAPLYRFQIPVRVVEKTDVAVRVERRDDRCCHYRAKSIPADPESWWFHAVTGRHLDAVSGRRYWRLLARWMPETAKHAAGYLW